MQPGAELLDRDKEFDGACCVGGMRVLGLLRFQIGERRAASRNRIGRESGCNIVGNIGTRLGHKRQHDQRRQQNQQLSHHIVLRVCRL
ncbi:hypothetical protein [Taklimakanibacter lacteus]|uniref:hypothetical protein n=1 Tax=Taklimakanibacter lacteus TaxID=2268456 RepID=UPI0034D41CD6